MLRDGESVKDSSSKLLDLVKKIRLLGEDLPDAKVVETTPHRDGERTS